MTGEWEAGLERMRRGEVKRDEFMSGIRTFVAELVGQIKEQAPKGNRRVFGAVVGACPKCGSNLHLRDWEGRNYVKCSASVDPECKVSFDSDAEGKPLEICLFCQGPVRTTRNGGNVCVQCNKWQTKKEPDSSMSGP